ncbi:DeoR/GlpR family DNA-binding transcription regulator [Ruegeria sp. EL01]|uniref:DeoR/GlpR family DNA-binding transcription regulator n=1 Tax=Ruegeria sp. EL01 TaxID=2107578 RepID=UPI000EA800ED|nr:DeoR/GlpR family DNA-binding transcription regulator [Ruegeria sp. EL01]
MEKHASQYEELSMPLTASPDERWDFVLKSLKKEGRLTTGELAEHFGISEDSARRDLRELASKGLIQRVHGAALPASSAAQPFASRYKIASRIKTRLAELAVAHLTEGQVVLFDGGTTNLAIAEQVPRSLCITAVTNSPQIAIALSKKPNVDIILIGGTFDPRSQTTIGSTVLETVQRIKADVCFVGVHGVDALRGLTTPYYDEATIKAAMIASGKKVIAAVTKDKVGFTSAYKIESVCSLDSLIAEDQQEVVQQLSCIEDAGVPVELV